MFSLEEKRTPLLLAYDLQLFANDEGGEKTEEPTAKKIEDSRKEGQVAKSKELTSAAMLLAFFLCLRIFMSFIGERLVNVFPYFWRDIANETGDGLRMCVHGRSCLIRYSILRLRLHRLLYLHL